MTVYTNDTKPSTSYTNDESESLVSWADAESNWADTNATWGGFGNAFTNDTKPSTSYTNDTL